MGDRCYMKFDVCNRDLDAFKEAFTKVTGYPLGEIVYGATQYDGAMEIEIEEANYGLFYEITHMVEDKSCPPFFVYQGRGGSYDQMMHVFCNGEHATTMTNQDADILVRTDEDGEVNRESLANARRYIEIKRRWDVYSRVRR